MDDLITLYWIAKSRLVRTLGGSEGLLHAHIGLLIFFAAVLVLRHPMRSWIPVGVVWAFALGNELLDAISPGSSITIWEPFADIANTVFWPTLLFLLARRRGKSNDPHQAS